MTQPATVGSHLLYTYQAADHTSKTVVGQSRPAVVVKDWGSCYNVTVFPDCGDFDDGRATLTKTSIQLSACIAKGRLHWSGSPLEIEAEPEAPAGPAPESSAPEGAQSEPAAGRAQASEDASATPEAPKTRPKNKGGRPKKANP